MTITQQMAKHIRDVYFGTNWTEVNLKDSVAGVSWQQAITKIGGLNTIAALVFHVGYYVAPVLQVLRGGPLAASDGLSFNVPEITGEEQWQSLLNKTFAEAEAFAAQVESMDEALLNQVFSAPKYGTYYRNLHGIIEHTHYHLGQIVLIKKLLGN